MKKLFLSYSALLKRVADGSVTQTDLDEGLFYFGCCREQVFTASTDDAALRIMTAALKAEVDGRIAWRSRFGGNTYQDLGCLLLCNGYDAVSTVRYDVYNYEFVAASLRAGGIPLETVNR